MRYRTSFHWSLAVLAGMCLVCAGCSQPVDDAQAIEDMKAFVGDKAEAILAEGSTVIMPFEVDETGEIQPIEGLGPNGEEPVDVSSLEGLLTEEDGEKLRRGKFTAAICFHYMAADWPQLQMQGCKAVLEKYGVKVVAVTDAELKTEKQISDYETVIQMKPDLLITLPMDRDATASVLRKAAESGIVISLMDTVPTGFKHPDDYAGMVSADNYTNGRVAAEILAEHLGGKGQVAIFDNKHSMFHTDERSRAAREAFAKYPEIEIVAQEKVGTTEEAASKAESLLVAHPELKGLWTVWDGAGMAAAAVIENLGRKTVVTTVDLSHDSAYSIATGGALIGTGAQHPYDQGIAEAMIGLAALLKKPTPAYVNVPGERVTRSSMKRSWYRAFRSPMPPEIRAALEK